MPMRKCFIIYCFFLLFSCKKEKEDAHPFVDFTFSGNYDVVPVTVNFSCNLGAPYTITWNFGDGGTATGQHVAHTFTKQGYFKVYARVKSDDGVGEAVHDVNVSPYNRLKIFQVNATVSSQKADGSSWDPEPGVTNPDLYFRIYNAAGEELPVTSGYDPNTLSTQYPVSPAVIITDFDGYFTLQFLDYDFGAGDDVIETYKFRPADYFRDSLYFPSLFEKSGTLSSVGVKVMWLN